MRTRKSPSSAAKAAPISRPAGKPQAIELFAGAGGLGLGVTQAGFTPVQVVEWDRWCCDTLRENRRKRASWMVNWPEPIQSDVRAIDFSINEGKVDLVTGGPPCQPFSLGGKHKGFDDERDMWPEAVRAVREARPKAFIFENVKGLTRASFATYLSYITLQLRFPELARRSDEKWDEHLCRLEKHQTSRSRSGLRYRVLFRVLNAADYGVPQKRERVVFVGFRSDLDIEWSFPNAMHSLDSLLWSQCRTGEYWERHEVRKRDRVVDPRLAARVDQLMFDPGPAPWRTTRDAIADLPDPEVDADLSAEVADHRFQGGARAYPGHTGSPLDLPAKTLKAGVHGVPGGENMLARADGSVRYFTVREAARLQTFPDDFAFHGAWSETMRQLGNAVPVLLASTVAKHVKRQLDMRARLEDMGL
jgi:DNA (cytosine-5)-methyltransferase 1